MRHSIKVRTRKVALSSKCLQIETCDWLPCRCVSELQASEYKTQYFHANRGNTSREPRPRTETRFSRVYIRRKHVQKFANLFGKCIDPSGVNFVRGACNSFFDLPHLNLYISDCRPEEYYSTAAVSPPWAITKVTSMFLTLQS